MKTLQKNCKCGKLLNWHCDDIDMAYSPMTAICSCGMTYKESFFEERVKWCDKMNKKMLVGKYNYFGGFDL